MKRATIVIVVGAKHMDMGTGHGVVVGGKKSTTLVASYTEQNNEVLRKKGLTCLGTIQSKEGDLIYVWAQKSQLS